MKIYLYDQETGIYQGEDCSDTAFFLSDAEVVPEGSTTIAPPPAAKGTVPVFDREEARWNLQTLLTEETAGRSQPLMQF